MRRSIWKVCELFGVSADTKVMVNDYLNTFFKHSVEHHNGWGMALLDDGLISVEKEPVRAVDSAYLKNRLTGTVKTSRCMAHIRKATVGDVCFANTHPFVMSDISGKKWVFVHNGTIFDSPVLNSYIYVQEGTTDSERILFFIIEWINRLILNGFDDARKWNFINEIVLKLSPGNKLNFLLYDGDYMYVHMNEPGTLYRLVRPGSVLFSTHPLDNSAWEVFPQNQLLVYRDGKLIYEAAPHKNTYIHDEENMRYQYMDHAAL